MTLLTIAQNAADEIGILRPSTIISNTSIEAIKLLRYARRLGNRLMKGAEWQILRKEKTFTAVASETQTGILPGDFDRFVKETFWDRTNKRLVIGPVSSVEWQGLKTSSYDDTSAPKFVYRGGSILSIPAFAGGESVAFEYISNQWALSSGGAAQTSLLADSDTVLFDEELMTLGIVALYLDGDGQPAQTAYGVFGEYLDILLSNDQPRAGVMMAADIFGGVRRFSGVPTGSGSII